MALYKSMGRASLVWNELEEVLLDVEVALNNRPLSWLCGRRHTASCFDSLCYDVLSTKTCPSRIFRWRGHWLEEEGEVLWTGGYVKSPRDRHNMEHKPKEMNVKPADVVLIRDAERNGRKWSMGLVVKLRTRWGCKSRQGQSRKMLPSLNRQSSISSQWSFSCDQEQQKRDDPQLGPRGSEFTP